MKKLKYSEVKPVREQMLKDQHSVCAICGLSIAEGKDVLDHCHKEGHVRGVLHSGCNMLLGKLENNHRRYGVDLEAFLSGVLNYIKRQPDVVLVHPTHKTIEEKKTAAKKRKKKAQEKKK